ncbi:hypothetical protein [Lacticaseibacillus parakribbianus]|nr:hypothetical protein [Lacticaseibacillus parakribbianus]
MVKKSKHQSNANRKKQEQRRATAKTRVALQQVLAHGHFVKSSKPR